MSQKWTANTVTHLIGLPFGTSGKVNWQEAMEYVADAHEAALAAEREKHQGAQHHMEACRALLNVPDDEVLYEAIHQLREQLAAAVKALKEIANSNEDSQYLSKIADAALAKSQTRRGEIGGK